MTPARDRADEDVIVVTDAQVVDSPSRGTHAARGTDEETYGDQTAGDRDLNLADRQDRVDDEDLEDDDEDLADEPVLAGNADLDDADRHDADRDDADLEDADLDEAGLEDDRSLDERAHGTEPAASTEPGAVAEPVTVTGAGTDADSAPATAPVTGASAATGAPATGSSGLQAASSAPTTAAAGGNWPEIQALFVDDPLAAVTAAAQVAGGALNGLMAAAKDREQMLRGGWEGDETGTEKLRVALRDYRELTERLDQIASQL
jgi:hypothetical protein